MTFDIHPVAALFPLIEGDAFDALVSSIREDGLLEPIEYQGNTIIDGRNRLRACQAAGVEPSYRELPSGTDPVKYILNRNIHRRHLTTDQRGAIAAELANMAVGSNPGKGHVVTEGGSNDPPSAISIQQAADLMNVSASKVKRAKARMKNDPEAHEAAKRGEKPKKQKGESGVRTYQTIRKVALTEYTKLTGETWGEAWFRSNLKATIADRLPWTNSFNWAKEISEDRAEEVRQVVKDYAKANLETSISAPSPTCISSIATEEMAQAEAESLKKELDTTEETKLDRAIKAHKRLLDIQFDQRVKQYLDEILPMYADEYDRYKAFNDTYTGVFTDDEFRLLLSVLHPDRCQPERTTQFSKAFHIIKSKEEVLCKVKPNERPLSLPRTLDELIARRVRH